MELALGTRAIKPPCLLLFLSSSAVTTHDTGVFSFYPDNRPCNGFADVLQCYRAITPHIKLSGIRSGQTGRVHSAAGIECVHALQALWSVIHEHEWKQALT